MMVCGITMYSIEILKFKLQCTGVVEKLNQKWTHSSGLFFFVVFFVVGFFCFVHLHYSILCFEKCTARWRAVVNKWLCITLVYSEICWRVFLFYFIRLSELHISFSLYGLLVSFWIGCETFYAETENWTTVHPLIRSWSTF